MTAKREKVHFESVEELLGAPVAKDATSEIRIDQIFRLRIIHLRFWMMTGCRSLWKAYVSTACSCQYWFDRMMREPMR